MILGTSFGATGGILLGAVAVLLGLSAVLALAETGLVRTSLARARALDEAKRRGARSLVRLVEDPERFLAPVLLLVLVCQLVAATLVGVESSRLFGALGVAVGTVFEVVVIFVVAEAVPKQWAVRHADRAALFAAPLVAWVIRFPPVRVVSSVLIGLAHLLTPKSKDDVDQAEVTESELLALADVAVDEAVLEKEERALISSIIEFGDTIVREVMRPRPDVVAVEASHSTAAVLDASIESGYSRLPVYDKSLDEIVGIAYTRDLIREMTNGGSEGSVRPHCRPARYVPETKRVAPLLREMQRDQFQIAIVVDEYGGTAGIVTLEDLIEELVGEIADEFDIDEPLVQEVEPNTYRVSAKAPVDEINELLGSELPIGDWDTVGGLVLHLGGHVPAEGETFRCGAWSLVAERVQRRRIVGVRLRRCEDEPDLAGAGANLGTDPTPSASRADTAGVSAEELTARRLPQVESNPTAKDAKTPSRREQSAS